MNFSENIEVNRLIEIIENNFSSEKEFYRFAITKIKFNCNEISPKLSLSIEHYKSDNNIIKCQFKNPILYSVTNESNEYKIPHNCLFDYSFLSISEGFYDKNIDWNLNRINSLYTFRVCCQNFMIDVLTDEFPLFTFN